MGLINIEFLWNDLTDEAKKRIVKKLGEPESAANDPSYGNWDVFPMAIMQIDEDAIKEEHGNGDVSGD